MPQLLRTALLLGLLAGRTTACATSQCTTGTHGFWHPNRVDRQGERQGRWVIYYDDAHTQLQLKARYRHGRSVGRWRHYAIAGYCERREHFRRQGYIDITDYHPNGQLWYQGRARLVSEPTGLHYYWYGDWVIYSADGALEKVEAYDHGQRTASWSPTAGDLVP
ncbi:MAG: toxin-antitoxin system YwqK family antitoxin [Janthinobacterium lividum]